MNPRISFPSTGGYKEPKSNGKFKKVGISLPEGKK
jgi:hypothetical protein